MTKGKDKNIKKTESSDDEISKNEEEIKRLKSLLKPLKQKNEILKQRKISEKTKIYSTTLEEIEKKKIELYEEEKNLKKKHADELRKKYPQVYGVIMNPIGEKAKNGYCEHGITYCTTIERANSMANTYTNRDWQGSISAESSSGLSDGTMLKLDEVDEHYRYDD